MEANDFMCDGQSDSQARFGRQPCTGCLSKWLKHFFDEIRRDTDTGIANTNDCLVSGHLRADLNRTRGSVLDSVGEQVDDNLFETSPVPKDPQRFVCELEIEF